MRENNSMDMGESKLVAGGQSMLGRSSVLPNTTVIAGRNSMVSNYFD